MIKFSLSIIFSITLFLLLAHPTYASYLYLSPDSGSFEKDDNIKMQVKLNTQDDVINGVSAYLTFPQDKLEAKSVEINKAILPIVAEELVDGNVIKFSGGNFSSLSGSDLKIGTVTFKTKALGNATLDFIAGSAAPRTLDSSDSLSLSQSKKASLQIKDDRSDGNSNPSPKPSDRPNNRCRDKEALNKTRFASIISVLTDQKAKLDTIFVLVDDFTTSQGKNSTAYLEQRKVVDAKRNQAIEKLNTFKTDAANFNCDIKNPKDALNQLKKESHTAISAVKEYKEVLRNLIKILRNV